MKLHAPALHVYTYFDGLRHTEVAARITAACGVLDMREEGALPIMSSRGGFSPRQLLSAPSATRIRQALRYAAPRLDAFLVCLAPQHGSPSWLGLNQEWRQAVGAVTDEDCIGQVYLFYALYDGDPELTQLASAVATALPGGSEVRVETCTRPAAGFYLWEVPAAADDCLERVFVLLAPVAEESVSDAWVWPDGDLDLRPLPGYFWEMAKVRHEARRFAERRPQDRQAMLYDLASRFESSEQNDPEPSRTRERSLRRLQRETALAAAGEALLRTMGRTVEAAAHNARIWLEDWAENLPVQDSRSWAEGLAGPVGADREYVAWLLTEINDAADTVRDTVAYAQPMAQIGAADIEQRLRDLGERSDFRAALHASVVAAVGLLLAAVQALGYDLPMYASLQPAFIATVAAGGLFLLPAAALRSTPQLWRRIWIGVTAAGFAASVTWFVVTWLVRWQTAHPPPPPVSIAVSVATAAAVFGAWRWRRVSRSPYELR